MAYKHGVYVSEQPAAAAPIESAAGLQVVIGTAPVNMLADPAAAVNTPILVNSYDEAVKAVGWSDDFKSYTLCAAVAASFLLMGCGPIVLINVLDPEKHNDVVQDTEVSVVDGVANVLVVGLLLADLVVKKDDETTLEAGTDYTTAWNDDGTLNIVLIPEGKGDGAKTLKVSGKRIDPGKVEAGDIVGTVDPDSGKETGIEVVRQVYPKLSMTPGILLAPGFSAKAEVCAALQAKCAGMNGVFGCVCVVEIDSGETGAKKYTDVQTQKQTQAITGANAYAVWLHGKVGETFYYGSTLAAARMALTDAENEDLPNVSPSNKPVNISTACLEDGTEVLLDQEQANTVNGFGVATFLNMNGYRLWGNNTAAYPAGSDPKDRWISVRRFMLWAANTFILTYFQYVDNPANYRLIETIVDSENIRGNGFVARGVCARYELTFNEEENTTEDLINGVIKFHQFITPYTPAEDIENVIEFDPAALASALA